MARGGETPRTRRTGRPVTLLDLALTALVVAGALLSARPREATSAAADTKRAPGSDRAAVIDFDREVRPILAAKCYACHGFDAEARKAGLRLDTREGATSVRTGGRAAIVPGEPESSLALARVAHADPDERMPPVGEPLDEREIGILGRWIREGATYAEPWAFRPIGRAQPPGVRDEAWCRGPVDRYVLATREAAGFGAPAAALDLEALVRKLSFDLRGLPPDEADLRAIQADLTDDAIARLVDRYLADPAFGERWGRHWLDLARYAESLAHEFDYDVPEAWRYRDYVIEALNADVPPARFVAEQIMGDLLPPRPGLGLPNVAPLGTAWWCLGPATHAPVDVRQDEADRIAGAVDVAGRSLFGLSIACARCHDHKFDPIPAKDFYALAGVARNVRRVVGFIDADPRADGLLREARAALLEASRAVPPATGLDVARGNDGSFDVIDDVRDGGSRWSIAGPAFALSGTAVACAADGSLHLAEPGTIDSGRLDARLGGSARSPDFDVRRRYLHVRLRGASSWVRVIIDGYWLDDRNPLLFEGMRRQLAHPEPGELPWRFETFDLGRYQGERAYLELLDEAGGSIEVDAILASDAAEPPEPARWDADGPPSGGDAAGVDPALAARVTAARDALLACAPPIRALVGEEGGSADEPVHVRGSSRSHGEKVPRAELSILAVAGTSGSASRGPDLVGSGRAALVDALLDPGRPFFWRTTANRVWLKLFGRGIVETPDDFGQLGATPWSVALLDHLAARLADGATLKQLVREIVLSRAYASAPESIETPPEVWAPLPVRRLDAESIRDAMLAAAGALDRTMGGPSVPVRLTEHMQGRGRPGASGPVDGAGRRSVYLAVRRNFLDPFLQAFDQPAPSTTCGRRHASNVPAQSLALLNSELVHEIAGRWGAALADARDGAGLPRSDGSRVESMWIAAYARAPRAEESASAIEFLDAERASAADAGVSDPAARERAAFAALAHVLFASKEFVFLR